MIFTGQPDFIPKYQYRVSVTVKGTLFSKGMAWQGPWVQSAGNGPLIVNVPMQDDPGVTITKGLPSTFVAAQPGRVPPPRNGGRVPPPRDVPASASNVMGWSDGSGSSGALAKGGPPKAVASKDVVFGGFVTASELP
jgi:hypothetical protein